MNISKWVSIALVIKDMQERFWVSLYVGFIIVVEDYVALNHIQQQLEDIYVYWAIFGSGQFLL